MKPRFVVTAITLFALQPLFAQTLPSKGDSYLDSIRDTLPLPAGTVFTNAGIVYTQQWMIATNRELEGGVWRETVVSNLTTSVLGSVETDEQLAEWRARRAKWAADKIAEEERLGINKEMRAYWKNLRKNESLLKKRMTIDEVVKILGEPTEISVYVPRPDSAEHLDLEVVTSDEYRRRGGEARVCYAPNGKGVARELRPDSTLYRKLFLQFDSDGLLERWGF